MIDSAINKFLDNKKQDFLKKKIKSSTSEEDKANFTQESNTKFALEKWLLDASSRAKQLSLTSHPAKFIHPNAKVSSILVNVANCNDGLLRSGNVKASLDVFGNAAALDVEKFLRLELHDNKTVLQHLEDQTNYIKSQFNVKSISFDDLHSGFLQIKKSKIKQTSEKIKQVYFPVGDDYHLLSLLNPSGIIFKLKQQINYTRFSEKNKKIKDELKKTKPNPLTGKIKDVKDLTSFGYGGTKPQNISTLNNQNRGVSYLLFSSPPKLTKRKTQPPKKDFFMETLWSGLFKKEFEDFHKVLVWQNNNITIRDKRDGIVIGSLAKVKRLICNIRGITTHWSDSETYNGLYQWQKIWLDNQYTDIRSDKNANDDYLVKAQSSFANWFIGHYKNDIKRSKLLGDDDIARIKFILNEEMEMFQ